MKITICIPCVDIHIPLLLKLLSTIDSFTRKPDKIMISLSPKFDNNDLVEEKNMILALFPHLPLDIIVQTNKTNAAKHLNIMGNMIKDGYIIRADADDIIHSQKLEIIEKILVDYPDTKLILHRCHVSTERDYSMKKLALYPTLHFKHVIHNDIKYGNTNHTETSESLSKKLNRPLDFLAKSNWIVNGANNYHYSVFNDLEYNNKPFAEDIEFNRNVTHKYDKTIFLDLKLVDIISSRTWRN